jgi:hypothetical protein
VIAGGCELVDAPVALLERFVAEALQHQGGGAISLRVIVICVSSNPPASPVSQAARLPAPDLSL